MSGISAMTFDLDNTLIDRNKAADVMFFIIVKECYSNIATDEMLQSFRKYDNNGYSNKVTVLNSLFNDYPPDYRMPDSDIYAFWDSRFSECFSVDTKMHALLEKISHCTKTAIITNGRTEMQKAKIEKTRLNKIFDVIIISDEVGIKKPYPQIFNLALQRLNVKPNESIYVGDSLKNDVGGCQSVGMKGVWFNPKKHRNDTGIEPYMEICNFAELLPLVGLNSCE